MREHLDIGRELPGVPKFVGGIRLPSLLANFGWPQAKLTFCEEGFEIGPGFIFVYVPRRRFRYEDLTEAQAVGTNVLARGIRFCSRDPSDWAIFWTPRRASRQRIFGVLDDFTRVASADPIPFNIFDTRPPNP